MGDAARGLLCHSAVGLLVPALIIFVFVQIVIGSLSTTLKRTRYWGLPALLFGALAIVAFAEASNLPPPEHGGPPVLDFGPLPYFALGFTAAISAFVSLSAASSARKKYLERQNAAPPELATAIVRDRQPG